MALGLPSLDSAVQPAGLGYPPPTRSTRRQHARLRVPSRAQVQYVSFTAYHGLEEWDHRPEPKGGDDKKGGGDKKGGDEKKGGDAKKP